jgi:hypothetical protein
MVFLLLLLALSAACASAHLLKAELPVVDLGYELHQAISFNVIANIYPTISFKADSMKFHRAHTGYTTSPTFDTQPHQ